MLRNFNCELERHCNAHALNVTATKQTTTHSPTTQDYALKKLSNIFSSESQIGCRAEL